MTFDHVGQHCVSMCRPRQCAMVELAECIESESSICLVQSGVHVSRSPVPTLFDHSNSSLRLKMAQMDSNGWSWLINVDHVGLCWALATVRSKPKALFRVGMRHFLSWWSAMKDAKEWCERGNEGLKKADRFRVPKWTHEDIWSLFECWNMSTYVNIWRTPRPSDMVGTGCSEKTVLNPACPKVLRSVEQRLYQTRRVLWLFLFIAWSCWKDRQKSHKIAFIIHNTLSFAFQGLWARKALRTCKRFIRSAR